LTPLPTPNLDGLLARLRARLVGHVKRYALGRILLVASSGLALLFLADLALDLPSAIRLLHLALLVGGLAYVVWRHLSRPMDAIPDRVGLAVLLERAHPELFELFTSAAQLSEVEAQSDRQAPLIQSVVARAEERAGDFALEAVDDPGVPRRALIHGFSALLIASLLFGTNPERSSIFFARMIGSGPAWPRATTLSVEIPLPSRPPGLISTEHIAVSCARGSDVPVVVRAEGEIPAEVVLQYESGARTVLSVTRGGVFHTLLRSVQEDMVFGVTGGDDTDGTPSVSVTVLRPPDVIGLAIHITPPAYTNAPQTLVTDADVEVLAGSSLRISVRTEPADAKGIVRVLPDRELSLQPGTWPLGGPEEGPAIPCREFMLEPVESLTFRFDLTDDRGLFNPDPGLFAVRVIPDRAPDIELLSPARGEVETVPGGAISLRARIADDHGIGEIATRLLSSPDAEPLLFPTESAPLAPWTPQHRDALFAFALIELTDVEADGATTERLPVIAGQTLQLEVVANDRRQPATEDGETRSSPIRVRVVSPDEFLRRLQDRLARIRSEIASLLDVENEKLAQTRELVRSLEGDDPGATDEDDAMALSNGLRRIHGDARSISRDLAEVTDNVIHARLNDRNAGLFAALVAATRTRTDRSFDPEIWRAIAGRDDVSTGLTGRLIGVTALAIEISDDLVEPARQAALRASRAGDAVSVHTALSEALVLQKEAHMKTEILLAELAEWDNFQSILSLTRDILNRQKSLTERARHYAKEN